MLAAAGIVVTEISTPISAPDLVEVSESTPAAPAKKATMKEKSSGSEMNCGQRRARSCRSRSRPARSHLRDQREEEGGGDPEREADRERGQRAHARGPGGAATTATQSPASGPNSGPDDHRADDQDRRAEQDPDRGDQAGEDHEGEEVAAQLDVLRGPRLDLLPDHRVRRRARGGLLGAVGAASRSASRSPRARSSPRGARRAPSGRRSSRWRPRGRRRRGSRRPRACARRPSSTIRLQADGVASSSSRTCSARWRGTTIRRWTMRASVSAAGVA